MPDSTPLTAIIADFDLWVRRALGTSVIEAGFEVVAEAASIVDVLREAAYLHPALVVITQDAIGMNPLDILTELLDDGITPEVVLVTHDTSSRERAKSLGAYDVVDQGDPDALLAMLREIREIVETGERRRQGDRRSGEDRRVQQDWAKVTTQRRQGGERRKGPRRKDDLEPDAGTARPDTDPLA
jgi:DNA-binding NarL/FixJ family response regulator